MLLFLDPKIRRKFNISHLYFHFQAKFIYAMYYHHGRHSSDKNHVILTKSRSIAKKC